MTDLDAVQRDLEGVADALGRVWCSDDHDAIGRLTNATEGLLRVVAILTAELDDLRKHHAALRQRIDHRELGGPYAYLGGGQ